MLNKYRLVLLLGLVTAVIATRVQLAAQQESPPRPSRNIEELQRLPGAESRQETQTSPLSIETPDFMDWDRMASQSYRDGNWEVYINNTRLTFIGAVDMHPRLNRGSSLVAFSSKRTGAYEIYSMTTESAGYTESPSLTRLTFTNSDNINPSWSPNGAKIAFQSYRDGQSEIYVMNADGSGQTRLTSHSGYDGYPAWSPDGTKIAFNSNHSGQLYIYVMNIDGSGVTQLSNQIYSYNPSWSPDGTKIAYDADIENDGWQELWVMDANGANQHVLYDPPAQTDAWAHGWSPDGRYINFTYINFVYYQGNWYWENAFLRGYDTTQSTIQALTYDSRDWNPDWQTTDILAPVTTFRLLPSQSTDRFNVVWTGQDAGPSGILNYDFRYKMGANGLWYYLLASSQSYYEFTQALGGNTYYFQARARDRGGNVEAWNATTYTTIENLPPRTQVTPLKPFTRVTEPLILNWSGFDPGSSGVAEYNTKYRIDNQNWVTWQTVTEGPLDFITGTAGHWYGFQVRGVDNARNYEGWIGNNGNTATTLYATAVTGGVQDNSGTPIQGITLTTDPLSFQHVNGDENGRFASYLATQVLTYTTSWAKDGYGPLPTTTFSSATDVELPIVLPPVDNIVVNSGFETGSFAPEWTPAGSAAPVLTETIRHTGQSSAFLGQGGEPVVNGRFLSDGIAPQLVLDDNQIEHVVWKTDAGLYYAHRLGNGGWSTEEAVAPDMAANAYLLAIDAANTLHLLWKTTDGMRYAQRAGSSWSAPESVNTSSNTTHLQMFVTQNGTVHVVWEAVPGDDYYSDVFYQERTSGGTWMLPQNISHSLHISTYASSMTVDEQGTVHVLWDEVPTLSGPGYSDIFYTRHPVGGSWSPPMNISQQPWSTSNTPKLIAEANGVVHAVWNYLGDFSLYYSRRGLDGVWSTPFKFSYGNILIGSKLTLDKDGNLHVVFGQNFGHEHIIRDKNGNWSAVDYLYPLGLNPIQILAHVIDDNGLAHVVFQESSGNYDTYYSQQTFTGQWTNPQKITGDPETDNFIGLQLQVDTDGQNHIIWNDIFLRIYFAGPEWTAVADISELTQPLTIPLTMSVPTLSYLYKAGGLRTGGGSSLSVLVNDGAMVTPLASLANSHVFWSAQSIDLTPWLGQAISLTFRLEQVADAPLAWAYLDGVTIGAAHPDVWVSASDASGLRGEQVVHTLTYGNRGGAIAAGTLLTYTLPSDLAFVSASVPPISTLPLVWNLDDLPARSEAFTLTVVTEVLPTAVAFSTLNSTAVIQSTTTELEALNNSAQGQTYIGQFAYLPRITH